MCSLTDRKQNNDRKNPDNNPKRRESRPKFIREHALNRYRDGAENIHREKFSKNNQLRHNISIKYFYHSFCMPADREIMCDQNQCPTLIIQRMKNIEHFHSCLRVECSCRLIRENHRWRSDDCSCDRDTLLLTTREFRRFMMKF